MTAESGEVWDYSDAAFAHLFLIFAVAAGQEIRDDHSRAMDRTRDAKLAKPESELRIHVLGEHGRDRMAQRPKDAFAFMGFASNRCYIVPSLDLVVVRLGYASANPL